MKITIFTIPDCYFSKQEKEYLNKHNLSFEERNLETNRDWLTEMLTISNNFAGTPVTKIEKDDGTIVVLKGFTKEEFDETLGIAPETPVQTAQQPTPVVVAKTGTPPPAIVQPQVVAPPPVVASPQVPDISAISAQIEELKRLQESLMQKSQSAQSQVSAPSPEPIVQPAVVASVPESVPQVQPVAPAPVESQAPVAVDDSLAAILAELQAKINASNSGSSTGNTQQS